MTEPMDDLNQVPTPCPTCNNSDVDTLVWDNPEEGDFVTCVICGTRYSPFTGKVQPSP
jgi:transcription elongation factor Elf1